MLGVHDSSILIVLKHPPGTLTMRVDVRWIWISSASTGRHEEILGKNVDSVKVANTLVCRWCLLVCVALARGVHWLASCLKGDFCVGRFLGLLVQGFGCWL